jgi:sulfur relay (sulfurtransferase) DsrC/TusE family protein
LDWYEAVLRALAVDTECIRDRHRHVVETVRRAWIDLLTSAPASR